MDELVHFAPPRVRRAAPMVETVLAAAPERVLPHVERTLELLEMARIGPSHQTVPFAQLLVRTASAVLASLAAGEVPPLTFPGRFRGLDDFFARLVGPGPGRVVDVGCGFPPVTSIELAAKLPGAVVIALDPALPHTEAVLPDGTRAYFDGACRFRHAVAGGMLVVKQDPPSEVERRAVAWAELHEDALRDALAPYADSAVRFLRARAGWLGASVGPARAIRAMNVLPYFQPEERAAFYAWAERVLDEGGVLLEGVNFAAGAETRFTLHEKHGGALSPVAAGFSIDCVRSYGPIAWMELRADPGPEALARLVGEVRRDAAFREEFDRFLDAQLARRGLLERRADGALHVLGAVSQAELAGALAGIVDALEEAGFARRAARILSDAGIAATSEGAGLVLTKIE
jgi:hypothetical protein